MPAIFDNNPPVTWLLSVKNNMPFLAETLRSIAEQTYRNHKILAWDDCSTDGSLEELQKWIPDVIPGKIFSGKSLRLGPCLAFLVEQAETELCARIDGDDIAVPHRLEKQVRYMLDHPEVAVLGSRMQVIDENGNELPSWAHPVDEAEINWRMRWEVKILHPTLLYRRSAILAAGNYPDFKVEDSALWVRMALNTKIHNHPEVLLKYRRSTVSQTGTIEDWMPLNRSVAEYCAAIMFPGITDSKRAMSLWEATHPQQCTHPVKLRHWFDFLRVERHHRKLLGERKDYFTSSAFFKEQRWLLRTRLLNKFGLGFVRKLRFR